MQQEMTYLQFLLRVDYLVPQGVGFDSGPPLWIKHTLCCHRIEDHALEQDLRSNFGNAQ